MPTNLVRQPLRLRRPALDVFAKTHFKREPDLPTVAGHADYALRKEMAAQLRAAAPTASSPSGIDLPYQAGNRDGMQKIKNFRSADCVVGGFRYASNKARRQETWSAHCCSASMTMTGLLHHVGFTSAIKQEEKPALTAKLERLIGKARLHRQRAGRPEPLVDRALGAMVPAKPKLVIEVCYDHFTGDRFRHGTSILRWRPDKAPKQCTFDQLKQRTADPMKLLACALTPRMQRSILHGALLVGRGSAPCGWVRYANQRRAPHQRGTEVSYLIQPVAIAVARSSWPLRRASAAIARDRRARGGTSPASDHRQFEDRVARVRRAGLDDMRIGCTSR